MAGARNQSKPNFLWQAVLILLPVVVLASIGWASLRQDKILAQNEAAERAQAIADDLVQKIWSELTATGSPEGIQFRFRVDDSGRLIFPPSCLAVPTPGPFDIDRLNLGQTRLWAAIQNATDEGQGRGALIQTCNNFIESGPPDNFAAAAHYQLGLLLTSAEQPQAAAGQFESVLEKYPDARGESGLTLPPLAQLKLLQLLAHAPTRLVLKNALSVDSFCSNAVAYPTPLTPELLRQIAVLSNTTTNGNLQLNRANIQQWQDRWQQEEISRQLFQAALPHLRTGRSAPALLAMEAGTGGRDRAATTLDSPAPRLFWFNTSDPIDERPPNGLAVADRNWVAVRVAGPGTNLAFECQGESVIGFRLNRMLADARRIPEYFGIRLELAGKPILAFAPDLTLWETTHYSYKGGGDWKKNYLKAQATTPLASAVYREGGRDQLKVNVYLTSPTALFVRQRARAFWFALLIAVSTLAALVGFVAAHRSFRRQLRLSEMKSNFVSSVSHELRAPIASVRLLAESLERGKVSEPQKQNEYFRFIVQECQRLSSLIENVLDFSRIEQGRKQYEFEPTDLVTLTRGTVKLMEPYAAEKGVGLKLETSNSDESRAGIQHRTSNIEAVVDGRALQQALVNLIDNAIKHSPKGETVTVGLEVRGAGCQVSGDAEPDPSHLTPRTSCLTLSVIDHGPGIPAAEHEKIFERFYRLGSELRRETQGVGIGLSLVKHIVEAHGGRVLVESEVGKGSRFTIELPVQR